MVGTSDGTAPYDRNRSDKSPACSLVRGTNTRQPKSAFVSNHDKAARLLTTSPITRTTGPLNAAAFTSAASAPRVETTVCWSVVVPARVAATAVSAGRPPRINASATVAGDSTRSATIVD